jgi:hypothetical protein
MPLNGLPPCVLIIAMATTAEMVRYGDCPSVTCGSYYSNVSRGKKLKKLDIDIFYLSEILIHRDKGQIKMPGKKILIGIIKI